MTVTNAEDVLKLFEKYNLEVRVENISDLPQDSREIRWIVSKSEQVERWIQQLPSHQSLEIELNQETASWIRNNQKILQQKREQVRFHQPSFEKLEMSMEKNEQVLNLKELYAIGPSISILMEGYVESKTGLVSLRGTMVPAKTLNKFLSKLPIVGDILIPKEIGEGLFGISFKMKGSPGKIKTTVNPIKTLTPRFIQKALKRAK